MSVREFFSTRYTFPGYTFLLFTLSMIIKHIQPNIGSNNSFVSAFFAFIYLLSGAPLGFLISQTWYLYFFNIKKGNYYRGIFCKRPRKYIDYLINDNSIKVSPIPEKAIIVSDYLNHQSNNESLSAYNSRRWDLINMMGATSFSIILGIIIGVIIQYGYFKDFSNYIFILCNISIDLNYIIIFIGILLLISFSYGRDRIEDEHEEMVLVVIKKSLSKNDIKDLFDKSYFQQDK